VALTVNHTRTLVDLARENGMTMTELLEQNPALARSPHVPQGQAINVLRKRRGRAA
jgi:hypothetical protein